MLQDRFGYRPLHLIACALTYLAIHVMLGFTSIGAIFPISLLSFAWASQLTIWPCIPRLIPSSDVSTAIGIATSLMNLGLVIFPILIAWVGLFDSNLNGFHSFLYEEVTFIVLSCLALGAGLAIWHLDRHRHGHALSKKELDSVSVPYEMIPFHKLISSSPEVKYLLHHVFPSLIHFNVERSLSQPPNCYIMHLYPDKLN